MRAASALAESRRRVVGVADLAVSDRAGELLVTYALGSCLGIAVYDPVACVGGLLHVMLPLSTLDARKAAANPAMFVDTGVPRLFTECYRAGAVKERLIVKVAGGARLQGREGDDTFRIGERNVLMLRKLLWKNGVLVEAQDVGGEHWRTMSLQMGTGTVTVRTEAGEVEL